MLAKKSTKSFSLVGTSLSLEIGKDVVDLATNFDKDVIKVLITNNEI